MKSNKDWIAMNFVEHVRTLTNIEIRLTFILPQARLDSPAYIFRPKVSPVYIFRPKVDARARREENTLG